MSTSKLMKQLAKEHKIQHRSAFNEELLEQLFNTICKIDPKNLMLVEFLSLIIQRDFLKNTNTLQDFVSLYDDFKSQPSVQNTTTMTPATQQSECEELKFTKKKFLTMLKALAQQLYPGYENAYETILYDKLTRLDFDDVRMKADDSIRKMLNRQTIDVLGEFQNEMQTVFEVYMPENFNLNLEFKWDEIKVLEKKLPIICSLRFLFEAEVVPQCISPSVFLEIVTKMKPPIIPSSGSSSKQAMFYTSETMSSYIRDFVYLPQIKLLEGDVGLTFFEFQVMFVKIATEFSKDSKGDLASSIRKLANFIKLKAAFEDGTSKKSKFMETVRSHLKKNLGAKSEKIVVRKRESRRKIEDLYDAKDVQMQEEASKNIYRNMTVQRSDLDLIRKDLDNELGELPTRKKVDKQNSGYFDVQKKHVVIGQQLPKIQQKAKAAAPRDPKKKNEDPLMGYKPETAKSTQESDIGKMIHRPKKLRINTQFPIILNEVFYPSDLNNKLFISAKAQIYLQTSYIHLGERMYEQAFSHYSKAKANTQSKSPLTEFYYHLHAAQIFQSAGRDQIALSFYHRAKELLAVLNSVEGAARAHPYVGMGVCLYHLQEYEYAFRCFQKAKTVYGLNLNVESIDNAILQNNIGCCLMMLNRNQEAIKYFQVGHHIFDMKAGCFDERTLVVQQNFNKNRRAYLELLPEFKTMWKTYMEKTNTKLPAVKTAAKKKK